MSSFLSPPAFRGLPLLLAVVLGAGCTSLSSLGGGPPPDHSASKLSRLTLGMDRAEVLRTMGEPVTAAAKGEVEVFTYMLSEPSLRDGKEALPARYQVRLRAGKVEAYGRPEDMKGFE